VLYKQSKFNFDQTGLGYLFGEKRRKGEKGEKANNLEKEIKGE